MPPASIQNVPLLSVQNVPRITHLKKVDNVYSFLTLELKQVATATQINFNMSNTRIAMLNLQHLIRLKQIFYNEIYVCSLEIIALYYPKKGLVQLLENNNKKSITITCKRL